MIGHYNKPLGMSSQAAVTRVKYGVGAKKAGHAGTLDPLATGVLIIATDADTKKLQDLMMNTDKEYRATIKLGQTSTTEDEEGEKTITATSEQLAKVTREKFEAALPGFIGSIMQVPPMFSALKKNGVPLYKLARKGEEIERPARPALIKQITFIDFNGEDNTAVIDVVCGKGVYIRSLVRDIGQELGVGAYMSGLVRTRVGDFKIGDALPVPERNNR